ncbi:MAG TPA: SGNH/GDSL hydrolase family protein [Archangium sp.]|uniref:SGNH/GDSL hydrolase family protein n=1 Tax=Archangium sp. TaxID=1872627 RepID=UPI002E31E1A4|nr:SGNH/GDSL hydrolase family protein [Archangium sp.]HEX5746670.1 SGNH/GDSL hydrolase family protein [Archangium sp.]
MKILKRKPRVSLRQACRSLPLVPLLTLAMGCGEVEGAREKDVPPTAASARPEACLTLLHEDTRFSEETQRDLVQTPRAEGLTDLACLQEGTFTREDLQRLGFSVPEVGSIDVENGYRALLRFTDGSTAVYVDSRSRLLSPDKPRVLESVKVEWCPVSITLEGQSDAQAACLGLGESGLPGSTPASLRELRVAPGFELELQGSDGKRYHANRTVSDSGRLSALRQPASLTRAVVSRMSARPSVSSMQSVPAGERIELTPTEVQASAMTNRMLLTDLRRLVIFGDSLSDQRNMHSSYLFWVPNGHHGYWNGRFTNGYNWVDYLVRDYNVLAPKVYNEAWGGAELRRNLIDRPSLKTRASRYIDTLRQNGQLGTIRESLFVFWGGANDVMNRVSESGWETVSPVAFSTELRNSVMETVQIVSTATSSSYAAALLVGLPDIATVPLASYDGWTQQKKDWVQLTTFLFNDDLEYQAGFMTNTLYFELNDFIRSWLNGTYRSSGMTNFSTSCYVGSAADTSWSPSYVDKPCPGYMFFDKVHPTSIAHCGIAGEIAGVLSSGFDTIPSGDRSARLNACAQRRQSNVRSFWRDAVVAPLSGQTAANNTCPNACVQLGTSLNESMGWNNQWTNSGATGLCGCVSAGSQPAAFTQNAQLGFALSGQGEAELMCPVTCEYKRSTMPDGLYWNLGWSNTTSGATCGCTSQPRD